TFHGSPSEVTSPTEHNDISEPISNIIKGVDNKRLNHQYEKGERQQKVNPQKGKCSLELLSFYIGGMTGI
ncbi:3890_t:CDS:2, partial [Paraglomus brasilianum]